MRMIPPFVEKTHLGLERFLISWSEILALRSMLGVSQPPISDTATFRVSVLAVGMRSRVPHGMAGATGMSNFFLAFWTMASMLKKKIRREEYRDFLLLTCTLFFLGGFQYLIAALLSFQNICTQMTTLLAQSFLVSM